jgi:ABC-2 type transport system permease protein
VLVVELAQFALIVVIGTVALTWTPGPDTSVALVLTALLLGTVAFAGLGLLMAGALRAEATLAGANGLYLVFLLLGGIVVPVDRLPGVLADLARLLPATALADLLRSALGTNVGDPTGSLVVLGAWGIVAVGLAMRTFRWE